MRKMYQTVNSKQFILLWRHLHSISHVKVLFYYAVIGFLSRKSSTIGMGICDTKLIDCTQMFGWPLLHSRYQLRGYHASFGTSTNRYKFSSANGNMSSVNVVGVVVDNNEAEALSSCEKKKKSWCDFWPLWKSNNWVQNSIHHELQMKPYNMRHHQQHSMCPEKLRREWMRNEEDFKLI